MTTADSSHESPRSLDGVHSPHNRKSLSSPWAQVVRGGGGEPESTSVAAVNQVALQPAPSTSPTPVASGSTPEQCSSIEISVAAADCGEGNNENAGKPNKPAWKKPLNGVTDVSPVMGAVSWPVLSKPTKFSRKSSPSVDSPSKVVLSDGSTPSPKGSARSHSPHKQASSNAKSNATSNHVMPFRQRPIKRGGGSGSGGGHTQSNFSHPTPSLPQTPQPFPLRPNGYGNMVQPMPDQSPREPSYRGNTWEPSVNDNRHSSRRGNFGPRGDGSYHNNFVGRRDQDRGHYGNPAQAQRSPRGFVRPIAPNTATFVATRPMGYPEMIYIPAVPVEPYRGMPFIPHAPHGMILPVPEPEPPLPVVILHQIEYYFSDTNLIGDEFLKSNMDDQGWVPVTLIAGFNRVRNMTTDIQLILDSLTNSAVVEVQDEKLRRRNDWAKWITSGSRRSADLNSQASSASSQEMLTNTLQEMTVEEANANQNSSIVESSKTMEEEAPGGFSEDASLS